VGVIWINKHFIYCRPIQHLSFEQLCIIELSTRSICSSSNSEVRFVKQKVVCVFCSANSFTPEQREDRVTSCQDIVAMADADKILFNKIITGDETWWFACDPETKGQSSEWVGETFPRPKKLKFRKSHIKILFINFFDSQGAVYKNSYQKEY